MDVVGYLAGVLAEQKKVRWASFGGVLFSSGVVLLLAVMSAVFVLCTDFFLVYFLEFVLVVR